MIEVMPRHEIELGEGVTPYALEVVNDTIYRSFQTRLPVWWSTLIYDVQEDPENGEVYRGKFATRVAKYLRVRYGRISHEFLATIGSIAAQWSTTSALVEVDITDKFDWNDGMFADYDSCFWDSSRELIRPTMEEHGFLALRTYDREGIGRCWIAPIDEGWVLFNGYMEERFRKKIAPSSSASTAVFASILNAMYPKLHARRVALTNNGCASGLLYINGGVGYAFVDEESQLLRDSIANGLQNVSLFVYPSRGCGGCGKTYCDIWKKQGYYLCLDCYLRCCDIGTRWLEEE